MRMISITRRSCVSCVSLVRLIACIFCHSVASAFVGCTFGRRTAITSRPSFHHAHCRPSEDASACNEDVATPQGPFTTRRRIFGGIVTAAFLATYPYPSNALFDQQQNRRQLELCLVAVQRVVFWAETQAAALAAANDTDRRKALYLESRLGAKAILTRKIGGGATGRVYELATLQIPGCLVDLEWHAANQQQLGNKSLAARQRREVADLCTAFSEGLASVVEFDGLETLIDPSPRSTLTLSQYNDNKAVFVRRAFEELVIPSGNKLLRAFGPEALERSQAYIQQYYASEIPPSSLTRVQAPSQDLQQQSSN